MTEAYPLAWPAGQPRTPVHARRWSSFKSTQDKAQKALIAEIGRLGGRNVVLSTNIQLRRDGLPYAGQKEPVDSGVAVYFELKGRQQCFACDRWLKVWENIVAIMKTIEALRGIERWGSGDMVERAFTGFIAPPPPMVTPVSRSWWDVLEVRPDSSCDVIESSYKRLIRDHHPDLGGSHDKMAEINAAVAEARKARAA